MSCLAEERFVDLLDRGGLDASTLQEGDHLRACESCRDSWATVAAAGELLAESRPIPAGRAIRVIPLLAAAAMLLTIVAVITTRHPSSSVTTPVREPLTRFLEGNPDEARSGREALLKGGRKSLLGLVAARPKARGSDRFGALQDLIWEIKHAGVQDRADQALLTSLDLMKVDLVFEGSKVEEVLSFMRTFSKLNLVLDPSLESGTVKILRLKDASLRSVLETLCDIMDLDFDVRYGVVFLSKPMRLWSTDPQVALPAANGWSSPSPLTSDHGGTIQKLHSMRTTMEIINSPLSAVSAYLSETSGIPIRPEEAIELRLIMLKVQDVSLAHMLELLTLPFGWDLRIEGGKVVIFDPRR